MSPTSLRRRSSSSRDLARLLDGPALFRQLGDRLAQAPSGAAVQLNARRALQRGDGPTVLERGQSRSGFHPYPEVAVIQGPLEQIAAAPGVLGPFGQPGHRCDRRPSSLKTGAAEIGPFQNRQGPLVAGGTEPLERSRPDHVLK